MTQKTSRFAGVHSALVTPFDKFGAIDFEALSGLIAWQKREGIFGLVMAGSTGEGSTLSLTERQELIKNTKHMAKDLVVTAGAGSNCTKSAIELQKAMEDAGADATLQVVPYYNKPTQKGVYEHFSAIAKAAKVPIILYNAAGRTGIDLHPKTIAALAKEHENIIGIKDANPHMERLLDVLHLCKSARPDFLVLAGEDSPFLAYLALGGDGIISVTSQIAPTEMLAQYHAFMRGDVVYAQKIAQKLNGLCKLMFSHPNPIPVKTLLAAMGFIEKNFRSPLCSLYAHEEKALLLALQEFSFLKTFVAGECS